MSTTPITLVRSPTHLPVGEILAAWRDTNKFLVDVAETFEMPHSDFFSIVNQRNLSGLIGEIYSATLAARVSHLESNPHPDGRPDLLDISSREAFAHFHEDCLDKKTGAPLRSMLAPFKYGGIEVKCTIGDIVGGSSFEVGRCRIDFVKGLTFWAHHRHSCSLLGVYYDYCDLNDGAPQIRAIFHADLDEEDWGAVSVGRPDRKKTSNTSLVRSGRDKIRNGLIAYQDIPQVVAMLRRLRVGGV